ncbi:hypothetical protein [Plantactinospora sp. KLBMP9567]|uniref:hypothetical protein n=1 Tax=Plantactinospora sp. KLBMP9567 TaxID=3085900 RepID=UPI0029810414|nr:hypothetical protein [Plantactinospora sp. KLBMP9567]MDW5327329.1 hypothetical protein [Plantactinospora sp. KLBMP9567]MDW5330697.1 hypothetical protein [Plantactinospora sp. KLBMP9567]
MSDAPRTDRRVTADSGAIEITSEPIVLDHSVGRDAEAVDITPAHDAEPGPGGPGGRPSSRRRKIVLGSVLAVTLAGAAVLGSVSWRILQQKDATLAAPVEVAGLTRDESEGARATIEYLRTAVNAEINFAESFGAVYADPAGPDRSVLLFGGTTLVWQPERDLDRLFDLASEEDSTVAGVHEVDAGVLGGVMKCGTAPIRDGQLVFCGWADHGSIAMGMFPGRSLDESAALLRDIRDTVQSRD